MIAVVVVLWAVIVAGASVTAIVRAALVRPRRLDARLLPRVIVVRPCSGHEPGLDERLARTGGARRVVLAVHSSLDSAAPSVHRAARSLRSAGIATKVVHTLAEGPNHKADQIARALAQVTLGLDAIVVVADSDVDLDAVDLDALLEPLADPCVGAVWAPPMEAGPIATEGDAIAHAVLARSLHAFPLLAGIDRSGLVGKLFAVRARALADAGGFERLRDRLGEDVALAQALRRAAWWIEPAPVNAPTMTSGRSASEVIDRLARWTRVVRAERPWLLPSYPLLFAPSPLALVALLGAAIERDALIAGAAALVLLARLTIAGGSIRDVLRGDAALLAGFARALTRPTFEWRGRRLRLGAGGRLRQERPREQRERTLGDARDQRRTADVDEIEAGAGVDARELGGDGLALRSDAARDVARSDERLADRDPELRRLAAREHVANGDRQDARVASEPRGMGRPGLELEREERRALAALGEDPHRATRAIEQRRSVADRSGAVARVVEVDAERTDEGEEREAREVSGVHHRVSLHAEAELGEPQRDERIPPRRVIGDDEERVLARGGARLLEPADAHRAERALDAALGVPREPAREPARPASGDHDRSSS